MRSLTKFAIPTLIVFALSFFAFNGILSAMAQETAQTEQSEGYPALSPATAEGNEELQVAPAQTNPNQPTLSPDSQAFLNSLYRTLFALENGFYYGFPQETREKIFARFRGVLNEELASVDSHTELIPPPSVQEFAENSSGGFAGIGASVAVHPDDNKDAVEKMTAFSKKMREKYGEEKEREGVKSSPPTAAEIGEYKTLLIAVGTIGAHGLVIQEVYQGSPAEKAGVEPGWAVLSVDGKSIIGMFLPDAVNLVKGKIDTNVTLGITTANATPLEVVVTRGKVDMLLVRSASYKVTGKDKTAHNVGYLRIKEFHGKAAEQFSEELAKFVKSGVTKIIIDVRSNPGGGVPIVHDILSPLMPPGLVMFYTQTKDGGNGEVVFSTSDIPRIFSGEIVVLTDGYSASGSEALAGVLRDHKLATLIGSRTYGKGSMQITYPLPDGSILKFTTALYKLPSGELINRVGIEPDIHAEDNPDTKDVDEALQVALNFLASH